MINSNAYNMINVLDKAADASWTRNEVLSNNIANVDTPGYKRQDVQFEDMLSAEIENAGSGNIFSTLQDMDLENIEPTVYTDMSTLSTRLDGNNVDIDTENVELASNQIKYNALMESMSNEFSMIKAALS